MLSHSEDLERRIGFARDGFAVFGAGESPFDPAEWARLADLAFGDPDRFEMVTTGDTDEPAAVMVKRILLDGNPPRAPDPALAEAFLAIVGGKIGALEEIVGQRDLIVRRAQAHVIPAGGHIGRHRDSESSEHYVAAVVLLLHAPEEGGRFVVYQPDGQATVLPGFSVLITDAELPHEVLRVERGERRSLAFWLASAASP